MSPLPPPPAAPAENDLWLDTSVTPNLLKRWNGAAWVQVGAEPVGNELIVGTQTAITGAWTGVAGFAELRDGQQITYWLPYNASGNATLALTLSGGGVTEAIPCYYGGLTRVTTQYSAGSILHLTYRENATVYTTTVPKGWWAYANNDTNYYDRIRNGASLKAKMAITAGRLVVGDDSGVFHLAASVPFDVSRSILYAANASAINVYGSNYYLSYPYVALRNMISTFIGTANATCYLVGTLQNSTFTPATSFLTTTVPTTEDGYTYIALGGMSNTTQMCLYPEHPMYRFVDGAFKSLGQVAYEAHADIGEL